MTNEDSRAEPPVLRVVAGALISEGRVLIGQRKPGGSAGLKWEFPGGKVESGETPEVAVAREFEEELNLEVRVGAWLGRSETARKYGMLRLDLFQLDLVCGGENLQNRDHLAVRWIAAEQLAEFDWAKADLPLLDVAQRALELSLNRRPSS